MESGLAARAARHNLFGRETGVAIMAIHSEHSLASCPRDSTGTSATRSSAQAKPNPGDVGRFTPAAAFVPRARPPSAGEMHSEGGCSGGHRATLHRSRAVPPARSTRSQNLTSSAGPPARETATENGLAARRANLNQELGRGGDEKVRAAPPPLVFWQPTAPSA